MKAFFFYFLFFFPAFLFAQCNQYYPCQDSMRYPDKYHTTDYVYIPVCGCDGNTYRNCDAAYWWGGLNQWSDGPCSDFDIDLYPNMLSSDPTGLGHLRIFMKNPGTATLLIYSSFGMLMYERLFDTNLSNSVIPDANPFDLYVVQTYPRDVYILVVTVNGAKKAVKFIKIDE